MACDVNRDLPSRMGETDVITLLTLLTIQSLLGAFDNLWHHELSEDLRHRPAARTELALHTAREFLYAVIFAGIGWFRWQGCWAWAFLALLGIEIVITLTDFVIEDRTRRLPAFERVLHTVLTINFGALITLMAPVLAAWEAAPTALAPTSYGIWSIIMTVFSLGVFAWAVLDLAAVVRLGVPSWQRRPLRRGEKAMPKTILVTGATGFVGSALTRALIRRGDHVLALSRDPARARDRFGPLVEVTGSLDSIPADRRIDAIVNLAGAPIAAGRWSQARQAKLIGSRLAVTDAVLGLIRRLEHRPEALISASAIGYYGERGEEALSETSGAQPIFMSELCRAWEERAARAEALGLRVCRLRIGLVLGRDGGAAQPLALASRFGLGMVMGSGRQFVSWIHLADLMRLIVFALDRTDLAGPINAVAPEPVRQAAFARSLARAFGRKARLGIPARALQLGLGELAQLFLGSQRVRPDAALAAGFLYRFPEIGPAFADLFGAAADVPLKNTRLAVYINETCPICRIEMAHYAALSRAADRPIAFERIGRTTTGLPEFGLSATDLRRRLYLRDRNGGLHSGIDALAALWAELPRYRWAAALLRTPLLHGLGDLVYEGLCVPILARWNARLGAASPLVPR
jgi:uncharacterized protein